MKKLFLLFSILAIYSSTKLLAQTCVSNFSYYSNGLTVQFLDSSTVLSGNPTYLWDFGDGGTSIAQNPLHTYSNIGTYIVSLQLRTTTGCTSVFSDTITLTLPCSADFTYTVDSNNLVFFNNTSNPINNSTFQWDFGDGTSDTTISPTHWYNNPGTYVVTLTMTNSIGQTCSLFDTVYVNFCQAFFTKNISGSGIGTFNNYSTSSPSTLFRWNFGDGTPTLNKNDKSVTTHQYTTSGTYAVSLVLYDSISNCTSSYFDSVSVNLPNCSARYTYTIRQDTVLFTNQSTNFQSVIYDFGDGNQSSLANPSHVYTQSGTYTVCQTVLDSSNGCTDTYCDSFQVIVPQCSAGFNYLINEDTLHLTNQAINFTHLSYDFGDGSSSSQLNPTYIYSQSGTYIVCQTVFDSTRNCQQTFCDTVQINIPKCHAEFTFTTSADTIQITNTASNYTSINYNFGDGTSNTSENPTHIYTQSGIYVVCQTVFDSLRNCTDTFCDSIEIQVPKCEAGFTIQQIGDSISITNTAQNFTHLSYSFGDGSTSTETNPIHEYTQSNQYQITQVVFDSLRNCSDSITKSINVTISTSCVASFQVAIDTTNPGILYLINNSSDFNSHQYSWDFGDGTFGTGRTPSHNYAQSRAYPICLTVSDSKLGCQNTFCDTVGLDSNGRITNKSNGFILRIIDGSAIGLSEIVNPLNDVSIYPNPVMNSLNIKSKSQLNYEVLNLQGQLLKQGKKSTGIHTITVEELDVGIYFLRLYHDDNMSIKKFIKK
tara:strand:- start:10177 stop:12468 length:2292 start_codon:yes stop_codon:yes gene_type:complete